MRPLLLVLAALAALSLSSCSKFRSYDGPEVTRIVVMKTARQMHLMHHDEILRSFRIQLGNTADGPKRFEGDGRTPEGRYYIDRRNPNSAFHLSLGISYPNEADRAFAAEQGRSPGGDIFIHGRPNGSLPVRRSRDWTAGCIAVGNREMEDIYAMVRIGTPIDIFP
ncbi:MAG: L,D-transpeptidase family protein [Rhodobacteraceae bacterium]|nr:L,D-transpeptidase family protein [Paracoccaceae bacterium]